MDPYADQFWLQSLAATLKDSAERVWDSIVRGSNVTLAAEDDFRATSAIMRQIVERIDQDRAKERGDSIARAA